MKYRMTLLRTGTALILCAMLLLPIRSYAATPTTTYGFGSQKDVFITELQTGSQGSSGEEFVELYNNTDSDIDLADTAHAGKDAWKLQYFSGSKLAIILPVVATASGWANPFRTISLTGVIPAHDYYILAGQGYTPGSIDPDQTYTSTLADDGGALQLIDLAVAGSSNVATVHDRLAWSTDTTLSASTVLFTAVGTVGSLQRMPNTDNEYLNEDGTLTAFAAEGSISPKNIWQPPITPDPETPPSDDPSNPSVNVPETPPSQVLNDELLPPQITELLPNPASPQTDEVNEYIELYNPNDAAFNLKGYTLETGSTTLHDFTFTSDTILEPQAYRALYSAETGISLSNSGGQARLLDGTDTVLSQSETYTTASDGMAWALDETDATWKWTSSPTPSSVNLIIVPAVVKKTTSTATKSVKAATAKKTAAKVKGASTTKSKAKAKKTTAKKAKATKTVGAASTAPARPPAHIHIVALAAVAILGVAYGVYEYRHDLANRIYQFRTNRAARRTAGK